MRCNGHAGGQGYDVRLQDRAVKQYGYTAFTDESGVIWRGEPLHWGIPQTYSFTVFPIPISETRDQHLWLLRSIAGRPCALLHVAQNEEFEGHRSMGLRAFASGPTLALQPEMDDIAWGNGSEMAGTRPRQTEASN